MDRDMGLVRMEICSYHPLCFGTQSASICDWICSSERKDASEQLHPCDADSSHRMQDSCFTSLVAERITWDGTHLCSSVVLTGVVLQSFSPED